MIESSESNEATLTQGVTSEIVTVKSNPPEATQPTSLKPDNKNNRDYSKCITLKTALENYKAKLSNAKSDNKNTGYFLNIDDEETKKFIQEAQKVIEGCIENGVIDGSIEIKGRRANAFTVRVALKDDKGSFSADKFFDSEFCKNSEPKITAVTLYTTPDQIRGIRISKEEGKPKLYEIINGSYTIKFNWKVGKKDCSITMSINSDGTVVYSNLSKGLTFNDLEENTAVNITIGEDLPKKWTLAELVSQATNLQKSVGESEDTVTVNHPSSKVASVATPHQHAPAAQVQGPGQG